VVELIFLRNKFALILAYVSAIIAMADICKGRAVRRVERDGYRAFPDGPDTRHPVCLEGAVPWNCFIYRLTLYPAMFAGMALVCGLGALDTSILVLFGLVPSALFSNLVADFFDLDTDMTASIFAVGTLLFLFLVLPVYTFVVLCCS
jgi:hypothetical protein